MKKTLKLIWPFVAPYKKAVFLAFLSSFPLAGIKAYQAYLVKDIFDEGLDPGAPFSQALFLGSLLFGLALVNYPFRFIHFYTLKMTVERATCDIRAALQRKFQGLPMTFFNQKKQGNILSVAMSDTLVFAEGFKSSLDIIREPLTAVALIGVALYHDWQLALVILGVLPLFVFIFHKTGRIEREQVAKVQTNMADMTHGIAEGLIGQKIIKAFNLQRFVSQRYLEFQRQYLVNKKRAITVEEHAHPLVELIGALAFGGVIIFAHYRITSGELTTGGFLSFTAALALFMDPVRKFSSANVKVNQARAAGERIYSILELPSEIDKGTVEIKELKEGIEIKDLTFSYEEGPVLENFSLQVKVGERVGLAGLSGSGKSTLISLLLRLYPVERGKIFVDKVDINDLKLESVRNLFSLVSQDIFLFNDTVEQNLATGGEYAQDDIQKALEVSYADEFVKNLAQKEKTLIGDRGTRLSGGQAQRLTIARAFLRRSPVLLFDEATSALDNESEKKVQLALEKMVGESTVLAVAHRLSTIQDYDKIVVLKQGRIVEQGKHDELMKREGEYFKLYQLSSK